MKKNANLPRRLIRWCGANKKPVCTFYSLFMEEKPKKDGERSGQPQISTTRTILYRFARLLKCLERCLFFYVLIWNRELHLENCDRIFRAEIISCLPRTDKRNQTTFEQWCTCNNNFYKFYSRAKTKPLNSHIASSCSTSTSNSIFSATVFHFGMQYFNCKQNLLYTIELQKNLKFGKSGLIRFLHVTVYYP